MPTQPRPGSTLPTQQPATKESVEKVAQPAENLDVMSSAETRANPALPSSQAPAPAASMDDMEIEHNMPPDETNRQTPIPPGQEKIDAAARHRTVLKEIWGQRVL